MPELTSSESVPDTAQSTLEREFVSVFSDLADLFGNPRSHGAIYGLLFSSERPLSMEEISESAKGRQARACVSLRNLARFLAREGTANAPILT
jgi:DNA-binding transcriptional regulator GbsR (MarR family)